MAGVNAERMWPNRSMIYFMCEEDLSTFSSFPFTCLSTTLCELWKDAKRTGGHTDRTSHCEVNPVVQVKTDEAFAVVHLPIGESRS